VIWLEGRSLSYQTSTPYAAFVDLFTRFFGIHPEEKDLDKYEKIKATTGQLLPGGAQEAAPFFATILGIELTGEDLDRVKYLMAPDLRGRIFHTVAQIFERIAEKQPLVLVFEDLHWADATSLDLIESLMSLKDRASLGIVALFRPQRQDPSWRFHEVASRDYPHRYTSVQLEPLDEASSRILVANLLEIEDLPEQVRTLILKKAEGNPFYVEEVIRSLLDSKLVVRDNSHWRATGEIAKIQVPDTLSAVITARLDRLDDESKRTAQTAAVVGREFQLDVLKDVYETPHTLDPALGNLQRREIIREKSRLPDRLHLFKHSVTQETAYESLLKSKPREIHLRVAECLERVDPEKVNDIAWHFTEAKEDARALPYLIAAGGLAARSYSIPEAIGYYSRAVELAKSGDSGGLARRAFEGLGNALSFAFDIPSAIKTFEEMDDWAKAHDDVPLQVSAINKLAYTLAFNAGQFPSAEKHLAEAERLAELVKTGRGWWSRTLCAAGCARRWAISPVWSTT
jgi:predicted ATPase